MPTENQKGYGKAVLVSILGKGLRKFSILRKGLNHIRKFPTKPSISKSH